MAKNPKKAKTPEQKPQEPTPDEQKQEAPAPGENPEFDDSLDEASVGQEPQESGEAMEAAQEPQENEPEEGIECPDVRAEEPTPGLNPEDASEPKDPEGEPLKDADKSKEDDIVKQVHKYEDETDEEYEERILIAEMFKYMTGADGLPDSGVDVAKMVKDTWAVRKQGKPFPGFLTAKTILAKEFKAEAEKLKAKKA